MSLASCCGPDAMFPTVDSISTSATVGVVCGILLILEALIIAIILRHKPRTFWRRKFVVATTIIGVSMCIAAWQAFGVYDTLRGQDQMLWTPNDISAMTQWAGFGALALWGTIILLIAGANYVWSARD